MNAPLPPGFADRAVPRIRSDGWTPERRRAFLAAVAEGHTIEAACRFVGLSPASAYALRRRGDGAAFALGWQAACLLGRDALADRLTSRAIDGQVDTYTRADGETVTRHRYDNRLACALLTRFDRLAAAPVGGPGGPTAEPDSAFAARAAAGDFATFLDLVEGDGDADTVAGFLRAATVRNPQLPQLGRAGAGEEPTDDAAVAAIADEEIWYDEDGQRWLTNMAPPPGFSGWQDLAPGNPDYARTVTDEEYADNVTPADEAAARAPDAGAAAIGRAGNLAADPAFARCS